MTRQSDLQPAPAARRKRFSSIFSIICLLVSSLAIVVLITLLVSIFAKGGGYLSLDFLTGKHLEENPYWQRYRSSRYRVGGTECYLCFSGTADWRRDSYFPGRVPTP